MKQFRTILAVFLAVLMLAACGGSGNSGNSGNTDKPAQTNPSTQPTQPTESTQSTQPTQPTIVAYTEGLPVKTEVYVDVYAIEPVATISTELNGVVMNDAYEVLCAALTADGQFIWLYFRTDDYLESIDPSAEDRLENFELYQYAQEYLETGEASEYMDESMLDFLVKMYGESLVQFYEEPIRLYGVIKNSNDLCDDLYENTEAETMFFFTSIENTEGN